MRRSVLLALPILAVAVTSALTSWASGNALAAPTSRQIEMASLEESVNPLKNAFNKAKGKTRILVLLAPT